MFKNIASWTQRKLVWVNRLVTLVYFLLTFIAPIATVIAMFYSNGQIEEKWKAPLITIVIVLAIIFASTRFFKKAISKISIFNIDGSYNTKAQTCKHLLECFSSIIIPSVLLTISILLGTLLKEWIEFYNTLIIICMSFYLAGIVLDKFIIAFFDDELGIREKVKEANAIESRRASLR